MKNRFQLKWAGSKLQTIWKSFFKLCFYILLFIVIHYLLQLINILIIELDSLSISSFKEPLVVFDHIYRSLLDTFMNNTENKYQYTNDGTIIVAILAALQVARQLKRQSDTEEKENRIQEASFIKDYNQAFIENKTIAGMESHLEWFFNIYCEIEDVSDLVKKNKEIFKEIKEKYNDNYPEDKKKEIFEEIKKKYKEKYPEDLNMEKPLGKWINDSLSDTDNNLVLEEEKNIKSKVDNVSTKINNENIRIIGTEKQGVGVSSEKKEISCEISDNTDLFGKNTVENSIESAEEIDKEKCKDSIESSAKNGLQDLKNLIQLYDCLSASIENIQNKYKEVFRKNIDIIGSESRQALIDYLAYLEGLASVINNNGAMKIENIDSLMGYRFFVAVNNPVVQEIELRPFSIHYRNIYMLYEKWINKKIDEFSDLKKDKKNAMEELYKKRNNGAYGVPMCENSLHLTDEYKKIVGEQSYKKINNNNKKQMKVSTWE